MKKLIFFMVLISLSIPDLLAQIKLSDRSKFNDVKWQQTYGESSDDNATCIIKTMDNGFAITGNTHTTGVNSADIFLLKLNTDGSVLWEKKLGTSVNDLANSLIQTHDSGFIIVGATNFVSLDYYRDMFMVKLNSKGELLWSRTFGSSGWDIAYSIKQTADHGYIVVGYCDLNSTGYGLMITKFREDDTVEWSKFVDKVGNALIYPEVIQTNDEGFGIATNIHSVFGGPDMCFIKLNKYGMLEWSWAIGGNFDEEAVTVCQTPDNGYALAGFTNTYGAGSPDLFIVKIACTGTLQWTRTIGGDNDDYAFSILNSNDGGLIIAGESFSYGLGEIDMYILKLDDGGKYLWGKTIGRSEYDFIRSIVYDNDGGFLAVGSTGSLNSSDAYIVKTDSIGNTCGFSTTPAPHIDSGGSILKFPVKIDAISTTTESVNTSISSWGSNSYLCLTGVHQNSSQFPEKFSLLQNYPNPFNPITKIKFDIPSVGQRHVFDTKIIIYDLSGREVTTLVNEQLSPGSYSVDWDAGSYATGVYFYSLITEGFNETKRMVLIK